MLFNSIASTAILASTFLASFVSANFDLTKKDNSVVYWGQNGGWQVDPTKQQDLLTTCNNTNIDMIVIGFVTSFKGKSGFPIINLSNQCGGYLKDPVSGNDTDILSCPHVGDHITACQGLGKKVLLSLGGATYTKSQWANGAAARSSANEIWGMFGPPGSNPFKYRPFGLATVDGFDMDFEFADTSKFAPDFSNQLKNKFATNAARKYYLTAAPQCIQPDAALNTSLTSVDFDAIFIQFYNNPCGATTWNKGKAQTANTSFNLQMWQTFATTKSKNKNLKIFTGFIAGGVPGSSGYVSASVAQRIVADSIRFANYAGASFWDSSILNINAAYLGNVRKALNNPSAYNKRDLEAVEERDIKIPVGGASNLIAEDFLEAKAPAEAISKRRRRHMHHRRAF